MYLYVTGVAWVSPVIGVAMITSMNNVRGRLLRDYPTKTRSGTSEAIALCLSCKEHSAIGAHSVQTLNQIFNFGNSGNYGDFGYVPHSCLNASVGCTRVARRAGR